MSPVTFMPAGSCPAVSRRALLQAGAAGISSLTLGHAPLASSEPSAAVRQFGRAKSCILLFLFGAPPQHETFDPKPLAAAEIQGELKAISTALPGVAFGEGLPLTARVADRLTVIPSMTHPFPLHAVAYALSGLPSYTVDLETKPRDPAHWPYFGSIADHLWARQGVGDGELPRHVGLPWVFNSQVDDLGLIAGPYAAFLGQRHDPLWAKFEGTPLHTAPKCRHEQPREYIDPYAGVEENCRFVVDGAGRLGDHLTSDRFQSRQELLSQIDAALLRPDAVRESYTLQRQRALALLTSTSLREALDVSCEPADVREAYGYTLFGQSCLAARRLVSAGTKFVSVFWDAFGTYFSGGWDTHQNHYPRLKQYLLPGFDRAYAALIRDLDQCGLLDETLVICMGEHGRTPQIDSKPVGAARHHWSQAYSAVLAGGGVPRGAVVGRSDAIGGEVLDTPVSPKDIHATAFHLLGLDPQALMFDRQHRPYPVAGSGVVRTELLA